MNRALRLIFITSFIAVGAAALAWVGWGLASRLPIDRAAGRLTGKDSRLRREAVEYLVNSQRPYATERLAVFLATQPRFTAERTEVLAAMAELGPKAVIPMFLALHLDPRDLPEGGPALHRYVLQGDARDLVRKIGPPAATHLIPFLEWPDDNVRADSAELLGFTKDEAAASALVGLLDDKAPSIRRAALRGLAYLKDGTTVEVIIRVLESDRNSSVRAAAARTLGAIGDRRAVEPLINALDDMEGEIRSSAAGAFQMMPDPRAAERLLRCLSDPESRVRGAALRAFTKISDERAVEPVIRILIEGDSSVREVAASALARAGDSRAVEPLASVLKDEKPRTRVAVARALMVLGDARGMDALIGMLGGPDLAIRGDAIEGLSFSRDPRAVAGGSEGRRRALRCRPQQVRRRVSREHKARQPA
ncbi:MAG: HEAT repeat domain-containing protein [Planctomycetota bacterium]|jgi:HEAT repeat protein